MSTNKQDLARRMSAAAGSRAQGASSPGRTAIRTKPVRITLDLDPATYKELNRWLGSAAIAVNPDHPRLSIAQALRAMIHITTNKEEVTGYVVDLLRQEQSSPAE